MIFTSFHGWGGSRGGGWSTDDPSVVGGLVLQILNSGDQISCCRKYDGPALRFKTVYCFESQPIKYGKSGLETVFRKGIREGWEWREGPID